MTEWDFGKPVSDNIILVNQLMRKFKLLLRRKGFLSQRWQMYVHIEGRIS